MTSLLVSGKTWGIVSVAIGTLLAIIQVITGEDIRIAGSLVGLGGLLLGLHYLLNSNQTGCLLGLGLLVFGAGLGLLLPSKSQNFIAEQLRPEITTTHLEMQASIQPLKFDKTTRGTLIVSLTNKSDQVIVAQNVVVSVPPKFFPTGFIVNGQSQPPYIAKSDGEGGLLGSPTLPSLTFAGTRIAPAQTLTLTVPLIPNSAGNYLGEIKVSMPMAKDSGFKGSFSAASSSVVVTVLP